MPNTTPRDAGVPQPLEVGEAADTAPDLNRDTDRFDDARDRRAIAFPRLEGGIEIDDVNEAGALLLPG